MNKGDYLLTFLLGLIVVLWFFAGFCFLVWVMITLMIPPSPRLIRLTDFRFYALFFSMLIFLICAATFSRVLD